MFQYVPVSSIVAPGGKVGLAVVVGLFLAAAWSSTCLMSWSMDDGVLAIE